MGSDEERVVVIATDNSEKALFIVARDATMYDRLTIHYQDKYEKNVEYILRILRKGCGWMEEARGKTKTVNNRCLHNLNGYCANQKNPLQEGNKHKCVENTRAACQFYQKSFSKEFEVNFVVIEKVGQIRGL